MGSYISIGFIAEGNKKIFLEKCIRLIGALDKFMIISVKYPTDDSYSVWVEQGINESKLEDVLEYCYQYEMQKYNVILN